MTDFINYVLVNESWKIVVSLVVFSGLSAYVKRGAEWQIKNG